MHKRIIVVIGVLIMILNSMTVLSDEAVKNPGENILYFCEDFNTLSDSLKVKTMELNPLNNRICINETDSGNKVAQIIMNCGSDAQNPSIVKRFGSVRPTGDVVIEADIMLKNIGNCSPRLAIRSSSSPSGAEIYPISISAAGKVTAYGDVVILNSIQTDKFYKFSLCFDFTNGTYDVYLDGEKVKADIEFPNDVYKDISLLLFNTRYAEDSCTTEYCIDNVKVYKGNVPLSDEEFKTTSWTLATSSDTVPSREMIECSTKEYLAFYPDAKSALVFGKYTKIDPVCVSSDGVTMIPARFLKSHIGETGLKDFNDDYISPEQIKTLTGMNVWTDKTGLVVISRSEINFNWKNNSTYLSSLCGEMIYERPSGADILLEMQKRYPDKSHPRLMVNSETFETVKSEIETNPIKAKWYADIKNQADAYLKQAVVSFPQTITSTTSFIDQGTEFQEMAQCLAFVYHIEDKDTRYSNRLISEIEAWINQETWAPYSMLALGRAVNGMAFAYDWLYDEIPATTKANLRKAISERFYSEVSKDYYNIEPRSRSYKWSLRSTGDNWNTTINSAVILSSLVMGDEEEYNAECALLLNEAMYSLESAFNMLAPDGSWFEGVAYWTPTVEAMVWIMEGLRNATDTDYGFFNVPGMKKAGYYLYEMSGEAAIFNFNFASQRGYPEPMLLYFAQRMNDNSLKQLCIDHYEKYRGESGIYMTASALILSGDILAERVDVVLPLDAYYRGVEAISMRSSWDKENMLYAGFHSGYNGAQNAQLDIGTFVIEAYGDRFITDFGPENYAISGASGDNFKAYMNRAEGANAYIINPSTDYMDQLKSAYCYFDRYETNDISALAITDMSDAYGSKVQSAVRGMKMTNNRGAIILQDEIKCTAPSDIYWGMHTPAKVTLSEDKKTALLDINGNKMEVKILSTQGEFSLDKAEPLPECFQLVGQTTHPQVTKLAMRFKDTKEVNVSLCFTPLGKQNQIPDVYPEVVSLSEWTLDSFDVVDLTLNSDKTQGKVKVVKTGTNVNHPRELTFYLAAYEDDCLTDLVSQKKELVQNGETDFEISFNKDFVPNGKTIKVFLLDEGNLKPYISYKQ